MIETSGFVLTSSSKADVAVGKADNFSAAPSTHDSSATKLVCNFVMMPNAFSQPKILRIHFIPFVINYFFLSSLACSHTHTFKKTSILTFSLSLTLFFSCNITLSDYLPIGQLGAYIIPAHIQSFNV